MTTPSDHGEGGHGDRPGPADGPDPRIVSGGFTGSSRRAAGRDDDGIAPGGMFGLRVLPAAWMRGLLGTATALLTVIIAMGDLASAWVLVVLPLTVAALVAYHEYLERLLNPVSPDEIR